MSTTILPQYKKHVCIKIMSSKIVVDIIAEACAMNDKCRTSGDDTSSAELLSLLNKILQGSDLE